MAEDTTYLFAGTDERPVQTGRQASIASGDQTSVPLESQQTNGLGITIAGDNSYTDVSISATKPIGGDTP